MTCVSVWAAGGELRPGLWSVLRDEAAHLRGRGQCQPVSSDVRNTFCFQVTTNTTQLQNPSFPATYSVGGTCVYLVKRQSDNICQIRSGTSWSWLLNRFSHYRLDFEQFTIGYSSSSPTGCVTGTTDVLSFSTPNQVQYPSVCGDISQQHSKY